MLARPDQLKKLTKQERDRFGLLEKTIEQNEQSTYDCLNEIHGDQLYREQFDTFDGYLEARFPDISKATYYKRLAHNRVNRVVKGLTCETKPVVSQNLAQIFDRVPEKEM